MSTSIRQQDPAQRAKEKAQLDGLHYSEANHLGVKEIKKAFSKRRVIFTKISDIVISEYEKKVVGPSNPRNEVDRFAVIRFQCVEPPTFAGRIMRPLDEFASTESKGDDGHVEDLAEPPKPETFPLVQLMNPGPDGFTGLETRLVCRRFKWKAKSIPNVWMWPAIIEFLALGKLPSTESATGEAPPKRSPREEEDEDSVDSPQDRIRVFRDSEQSLRKIAVEWEEKAKNAWKYAAVLAEIREQIRRGTPQRSPKEEEDEEKNYNKGSFLSEDHSDEDAELKQLA
ncbi:MAG: hypothetical protein Q9179_001932 [Wetmoreana sp. 5 TL-2023]